MKNMLALILALIMTAFVPVISETATETAEIEMEYYTIEGIVSEITSEFVMIETSDIGSVCVNLSADTAFMTDLPLVEGQYAVVTYNGMMTRSLPPQISAIMISNYRMFASIESIDADEEGNTISFTVLNDIHGEVIVHLPEGFYCSDYAQGDKILVYNNGAMSMSLPAQIGALHIVKLYEVSGIVTDVHEDSVMIETESGAVQVNLQADTEGLTEFQNGAAISVFYNGMMTRSMIPQISAARITVPVR